MSIARKAPRKNERLQLRVEPDVRELLGAAAAASGMSTSAFVLAHATTAARHVLADQTTFVLPKEHWDEFGQLLDGPARSVADLAALLAGPSIFDERG